MKKNSGNSKPYFAILALLGLLLSIFYYFYLKYYGGFYFVHYYEYYTRAVVVTDFLKKLDFSSALHYYLHSHVDKILLVRTVPFFLLFGSSQFVFFYSNVFLNLFLALILFHSLLKIMQPDKAFYFTLLILSQYFFIELLASFYADLNLFLICAIFFIYLSLFDKDPRKYNGRLIFMVFLIFLSKNVSYFLISVLGLLFIIYFLLSKKKKVTYLLRFLIILGIGFLIYYIFVLGLNYHRFVADIAAATEGEIGRRTFIEIIKNVTHYISSQGGFKNLHFVDKFPFSWLNLLIYPMVLFTYYKKREHFWLFLFVASDIFYFLLYNIRGFHHEHRYMLPFYFVYLYFLYDFIAIIFDKIARKNYANKFFVLIITVFFLTSFIRLTDPEERVRYSSHEYFPDFSGYIPIRSRVYVDSGVRYVYYGFIDAVEDDFSYLSKIDPRFKYKLVGDIKDADYVLCEDCSDQYIKKHKLIATKDRFYLFRIK